MLPGLPLLATFAAAAVSFLQQVPAPAGSEALDAQCFLASAARVDLPDPTQRDALVKSTYFFRGRLSARIADDRLEELLWKQLQAVNRGDQRRLMEVCGKIMIDAGVTMIRVGQQITIRERGGSPQ
jgi:hypothetical protein